MAAKKSVALFINAISVFNQTRYAADAAIAARFANLTEADVAISNLTIDSSTDVVSASIKSATRAWQGDNQTFKRAKLNNAKVTTFTTKTLQNVTDQASFLDAIQHIDTAGVYQVAVPELNGKTALLVIHAPIADGTADADKPAATIAEIKKVLEPALLYTFNSADEKVTLVGSTYQFEDNFIKDAVYFAPVGASVLTIPTTDYGNLDDQTYDATM
jgi:hypothetical protein